MSELRGEAVRLVLERGYERREEPFRLASGQLSHDYIDAKYAVDRGSALETVCRAIVALTEEHGVVFDAVGGLTMGADALAHGVALVSGSAWFSVRKEPKSRGRAQWIEGCRLAPGDRVLLVDDVITTGGSTQKAYERVVQTGAGVVAVVPMVDRGDEGAPWFTERGVRYLPLMTYRDLGIEPVRRNQEPAPVG